MYEHKPFYHRSGWPEVLISLGHVMAAAPRVRLARMGLGHGVDATRIRVSGQGTAITPWVRGASQGCGVSRPWTPLCGYF